MASPVIDLTNSDSDVSGDDHSINNKGAIADEHAIEIAIDSATIARLRTIMKQLDRQVDGVRRFLEEEMLVKLPAGDEVNGRGGQRTVNGEHANGSEGARKSGSPTMQKSGPAGHAQDKKSAARDRKRTLVRYALCKNCDEEFDAMWNHRLACQFHPGQKEVDSEDMFWADHEEDCHGRIEDLMDDEDFAEGFKWSCCEQLSDKPGCERDRHVPIVVQSKRSRLA